MKTSSLAFLVIATFLASNAFGQLSTPPATDAEKEEAYNQRVAGRTEAIVKTLNLTDKTKSNQTQQLIVAQYHKLRARDEAIDAKLKAAHQEVSYSTRADNLLAESKPLHNQFLTQLAQNLTPEQIEQVKDGMTYNKVKVTYDAYCAIVPGLTEDDKTVILAKLKLAREEAMDGGSAPEKSAIFQKYKDQINDYLDHHGHDVAKAYKDWDAKQAAATAIAKPSEPGK